MGGHISISGSKCNYFINDQYSLINVILPIFRFVELNSSKYYDYLIFEKVVNLVKDKNHLSHSLSPLPHLTMRERGESQVKKKLFNIIWKWKVKVLSLQLIVILILQTIDLAGFTDGDATFSTNKLVPRLKYENHVKELVLFLKKST